MTAVVARASLTRLARARRAWVPLVAWSSLALAAALVTRARGGVHGADDVLVGTLGPFVVPLLAYAAVSVVVGAGGLRGATRGFVAIGAPPRAAAFGTSLVAMALAAVTSGLATGVGALIAHGSSDPPLAVDVPMSVVTGALGGAAYGALFCAGAAVGAGGLRGVLLALDFVLGGEGPLGALLPRGHLLALLGSDSAIGDAFLPRRASSVALVVLAAAYFLVVVHASRRRP